MRIRSDFIKLMQYVSLPLPTLNRFPFESNNPMGYFVAFLLEYIVFGYFYLFSASLLVLSFGFYCFTMSAVEEIQRILHSIHKRAHVKEIQSNKFYLLCSEYIDTHGIIKQLSMPTCPQLLLEVDSHQPRKKRRYKNSLLAAQTGTF